MRVGEELAELARAGHELERMREVGSADDVMRAEDELDAAAMAYARKRRRA